MVCSHALTIYWMAIASSFLLHEEFPFHWTLSENSQYCETNYHDKDEQEDDPSILLHEYELFLTTLDWEGLSPDVVDVIVSVLIT